MAIATMLSQYVGHHTPPTGSPNNIEQRAVDELLLSWDREMFSARDKVERHSLVVLLRRCFGGGDWVMGEIGEIG